MGFGTGCNALLAYEYAQKHQLTLKYTTIEKYPLSETDLEALKQHTYASTATGQDFFNLHMRFLGIKKKQFPSVHFEKILGDYFEYSPKTRFDVVFYDAFGAHAQADLWAPTALEKAVELMDTNAVWVSYCAKGSVRRALQSFGLHVERLPGPPGKREMLRGTRKIARIKIRIFLKSLTLVNTSKYNPLANFLKIPVSIKIASVPNK